MDDYVTPGSGFLFMKVGVHAKESLESIIERKTKEIENAGVAFWGYGGGTCHPSTMVQPFAKTFEQKGGKIRLFMEEINSNHFAEQVRADEYSVDGITWEKVPKPINVLGSRYALVIKGLRRAEFDIPLAQTRVALGRSEGMLGTRYVRGRVDKGCLEIISPPDLSIESESKIIPIRLIADIVEPHAVFLRNK